MARPKKKPNYDPNKVMNDLLDTVVDAYDKSFVVNPEHGELKMVASELDMTPIKVRKLLITAGIRDDKEYYSNDRSSTFLSVIYKTCGWDTTKSYMVYGISHPKYHLVEFDLREVREIQPEQFVDPENLL